MYNSGSTTLKQFWFLAVFVCLLRRTVLELIARPSYKKKVSIQHSYAVSFCAKKSDAILCSQCSHANLTVMIIMHNSETLWNVTLLIPQRPLYAYRLLKTFANLQTFKNKRLKKVTRSRHCSLYVAELTLYYTLGETIYIVGKHGK